MGLFYDQLKKCTAIKQFSYNKTEKLKSRKLIEHLFSNGKSINMFPVKLLYDYVEEADTSLKAGVTASSRNFKKAVERNRVKRVLREAYRLQKPALLQLLEAKGLSIALFFIYTGKELPEFAEVQKRINLILQKLAKKIENAPKD
jgi:ribonuclease P protein component